MEIVYLDNNATTKPAPEVVEAMFPYWTEWYGNPSSVHRFGQRARQGVDEARGKVAGLLGCAESEVFFTGGGTEASNAAIRGLLAARGPVRKRVVTTTVEHSATRELCGQLAKEGAIELVQVGVDVLGRLDMGAFREAVTGETALATALWANNETGVIFPVAEMAAVCREKGVPFHCDGTQAVGKVPVNVAAAGVDVLTCAAHKFHGPKGVGAVYLRRGVRFRAMVVGGPQERNRRGGTENVPGIVGMGVAAELAKAHLGEMGRVAGMRDRLEREILARIDRTSVNGDRENRVPNTTNVGFERLEAEAILLLLSEQGVCASAGAACSSGSLEPSPVLRAMGVEEKVAHGAVRFSLSRYTTEGEIERVLGVLPGIIARLRSVLPVG